MNTLNLGGSWGTAKVKRAAFGSVAGGGVPAAISVLLLVFGMALAFTACETNADDDDTKDLVQKTKHLLGGTLGSGANAKPFYADKKQSSSNSSLRAAAGPQLAELEGKLEDGGFAITLKGTYDETSGKFLLGASSEALGIGYSIEGNTNNPEKVKAVVKTKNKTTNEWTETEVKVTFDTGAEVSETAQTDNGVDGLPAAWTGLYPYPESDKDSMKNYLDALVFEAQAESTLRFTGLGERLIDDLLLAVGPWGLSLQADFDAMDAKVDAFFVEKKAELEAKDIATDADAIKTAKKNLREQLSANVMSGFYISFLEVKPGEAGKAEDDPNARYAVAFTIKAGEDGTEAKLFIKLKITYDANTKTLTMIPAKGLEMDETATISYMEIDENGYLVQVFDENGEPATQEVTFKVQGVAATAQEARDATNFTYADNEPSGQVVMTR